MTLTITIELDNAAFRDEERPGNDRFADGAGAEVARILTKYAAEIRDTDCLEVNLRDVNGNTVGRASVS